MKLRVRAYAVALGLLLLCAGLFACATQVAPGGGPEDKLPPRVAAVYPAPMTTNHPNELYVKLEFDEWINASIPRSAVSISPPIEKKMKFEVSGRTLELTSRAVLDENTTYTITFAGGIKDLHGNALATNTQHRPPAKLFLMVRKSTHVPCLYRFASLQDTLQERKTRD